MTKVASKKIKPLKIVLWSISGLILLFIVIVLGSLLVQKFILKSHAPKFMGFSYLVVLTGSMTGTINQGDAVIIKETGDYKLGDIVAFVDPDSDLPIMHRLIRKGPIEGTFVSKGDANEQPDGALVFEENILGEVVYVIPKIGLVFNWVTEGGGVIYIAAMLIVLFGAVYIWRATAPEDEEEAKAENSEVNAASPAVSNTEATLAAVLKLNAENKAAALAKKKANSQAETAHEESGPPVTPEPNSEADTTVKSISESEADTEIAPDSLPDTTDKTE